MAETSAYSETAQILGFDPKNLGKLDSSLVPDHFSNSWFEEHVGISTRWRRLDDGDVVFESTIRPLRNAARYFLLLFAFELLVAFQAPGLLLFLMPVNVCLGLAYYKSQVRKQTASILITNYPVAANKQASGVIDSSQIKALVVRENTKRESHDDTAFVQLYLYLKDERFVLVYQDYKFRLKKFRKEIESISSLLKSKQPKQ